MTVQLECFVGNVRFIRVVLYYKGTGFNYPNFQLFEHTQILISLDKRGYTVCTSKKFPYVRICTFMHVIYFHMYCVYVHVYCVHVHCVHITCAHRANTYIYLHYGMYVYNNNIHKHICTCAYTHNKNYTV